MKKYVKILLFFLAALALVFSFSSCGREGTELWNTRWEFVLAQGTENNGAVVAVSAENSESYKEAEVVNISLRADNGYIVIKNEDSGEFIAGYFAKNAASSTDRDKIYEITFENGEEAVAGIGAVKYSDGNKETVLNIALENGYSLKFTEEKK